MACKLVILARGAAHGLSLADVQVASLVPPALRELERDDFRARLEELDAPLQARLDAHGAAHVGLCTLAAGHPGLHGRLTDNLVQFRTRRYADNPLVIKGPGAGPEVTAAGLFGDVLAIAQALGARV